MPCRPCGMVARAFASRPMWRRAASTCPVSSWSSMRTCRPIRNRSCTVRAARGAPAARGPRCLSCRCVKSQRRSASLKFANLEAEWSTPPSAEAVLARDEERLMSDPAWDRALSPEEQTFARPTLAGALSRKGRGRLSAALSRPATRRPRSSATRPSPACARRASPPPSGRAPGFRCRSGRKQRAEPRWLLPMLCRNAGLSKDAIGAIRVQYQETFIEILTDAVSAMKTELGPRTRDRTGRASDGTAGPAGNSTPRPRVRRPHRRFRKTCLARMRKRTDPPSGTRRAVEVKRAADRSDRTAQGKTRYAPGHGGQIQGEKAQARKAEPRTG